MSTSACAPIHGAGSVLHTATLGSVTAYRIEFRGPGSGPYLLAADPGRHALVLSSHGVIRAARAGRELLIRDEVVALCDIRVPLGIGPAARNQAAEAVVMDFPDVALPTALPDADEPHQEIRDAAVPGMLLRRFLVEAVTRAPGLRASEVARLGDAALQVAAAVLERYFAEVDEALPSAPQRELLTRIRGFIDRNLGDPFLTPGLVAAAHHVSIRHLQRLFRIEGSTPSEWIRQRRLENCRRELGDARLRSVPVCEIGLRNGFVQASDFSRAFRARYGVPPGRFRVGGAVGTRRDNRAVASPQ